MQAITSSPLSSSLEHKEEKNLVVTWRQFEVYCMTLGNKIDLDGWRPKAVIGIGRGGWEVAAALSRFFKIPSGAFMCKSYEKDGVCVGTELRTANDITFIGSLEGPVLIADDLVENGHTLKGTCEFIKAKYKNVDIRTATLFCKTLALFRSNYFVEMVDATTWVHLPNELYECFNVLGLPVKYKIILSEKPELFGRLIENRSENPREKMSEERMIQIIDQYK